MLRKVQSHFANYFNEDKLFDVSIIKGAELGTLYSDYEGYEADEFYLIPQENLFFIAETNVTIDEILIKASTEIPDAEWGGNNANYPKRSNRKGKDIIQPIGGATGGETLYGIGKISGGGGNCEDYACEGSYISEIPKFEIKVLETNYYKGKDLCKRGGGDHGEFILMTDNQFMIDHDNNPNTATIPLENEFLLPYEIDACYNTSDNMWQYKITTGEIDNKFILQAIVTLCLEGGSYTVLENISELDNIDNNMLCQALIDFEYQRPYRFNYTDYPEYNNFVIKEAVREHELIHKRRFEEIVLDEVINSGKYSGYEELLTFADAFNFSLECSNLDKSSAISLAKQQYNSIIGEFVERIKIKAKELSGKSNGSYEEREKNRDNELFTQWHSSVQNKITDYQNRIEEIARERGITLDCNYKQDWSQFYEYKNSL